MGFGLNRAHFAVKLFPFYLIFDQGDDHGQYGDENDCYNNEREILLYQRDIPEKVTGG